MANQLGNISFGLGADTAALQKSLDKLVQFGNQVDTVSRRQSEGAEKVAAAYRKQEQAVTSALQKTLNLTNSVRKVGGDSSLIDRTTTAFNRYTQQVTKGQQSALQMQRANERLQASLGIVNRELAAFKATKAAQETQSLVSTLRNLATSSTLALGPLGGVAARVGAFTTIVQNSSVQTAIFVAGMAAAVVSMAKLGTATVDAAVKMNSIRMQLTAVTGSAAVANEVLADIITIANKSGQEISSTAGAYAKFMAAANGTALAGAKARDIFQTVALTAGKMNLSADNAAGIFKALEQMMSKGTIQAEELRGQLGDRLPGAFNLMTQAMGVSTRQLGEMMKKGELLSADALPKLAEQLKKTFKIDGSGIDSYPAAIARLSTATTLFLDALDKEIGLSTALKNVFEGLAQVMDFLRQHVNQLWQVLGALGGAFIALNLGAIIGAFTTMAAAVRSAAAAMAALDIAIMANPFTGLLGLLAKVAIAIAGATAGWLGMRAVMGQSGQFSTAMTDLAALNEGLREAAGGMDYIAKKKRDTVTQEMFERQNRMIELNQTIANSKPQYTYGRGGQVTGTIDPSKAAREELARLEKEQAAAQRLKNENTKAMSENAARAKLDTGIVGTVGTGSGSGSGKDKGATLKQIEAQQTALQKFDIAYKGFLDQNKALQDGSQAALENADAATTYAGKMLAYKQLLDKTTKSEAERTDKLNKMGEALKENERLTRESTNSKAIVTQLNDAMGNSFDRVGSALGDMVMKGKVDMQSLADVFRSAAQDILATLTKLAIMNPLKNAIFGLEGKDALPSIGGGFMSAISSGISSMFGFGGAKAGGGPTQGGRMYLVGEEGPELWSDNSSGTITNNRQLKGLMGSDGDSAEGATHIHFNISTGVKETVRAELNQMMPGIVGQTKSAIADARQRGGAFAQTFRRN